MTFDSRTRAAVGTLVLSALALAGIATSEGYRADAYIPVPGDVPTVGYGTTTRPDGSPVRMGDTTTPERALIALSRDADRFAQAVRRCAPVPLYQHEFDVYVSFAYNVGEGAFCGATLARKLKAGDYPGACAELLRWNQVQGRVVRGLTVRRQREYRQCMGDSP